MTEKMTVREAIEILHNHQYQKHIGNGEYDYIHPLTDAQCMALEALLTRQQQEIEEIRGRWAGVCLENGHHLDLLRKQQQMLQRACEVLGGISRACPIPNTRENKDCTNCSDEISAKCWMTWLDAEQQGEV